MYHHLKYKSITLFAKTMQCSGQTYNVVLFLGAQKQIYEAVISRYKSRYLHRIRYMKHYLSVDIEVDIYCDI